MKNSAGKINIEKKLDNSINEVYNSLIGPMTKGNIKKTTLFIFDILNFIMETKPQICNELFIEVMREARKYFVEKSIDFSTFYLEAKKIRDYMNIGEGRRWFTWDDSEISCVRASLGLFVRIKTDGDHEYLLSDTILQVIECVNLNIEIISKDELIGFIDKHFRS